MAALARVILLFMSTLVVVHTEREMMRSPSTETSDPNTGGIRDHFSAEANPDTGVKVANAHALGDKSSLQVPSGNVETDPNPHGISETISNSASLSDEVKLVLMKHGIQADNQNLISDLVALASKDKPMMKHASHAALQTKETDSQLVSPSVKKDPEVNVFLDGDTKLLDLKTAVVAAWHAIPIGFRVEGKIEEIRKFLTMRGVWHLEAHCHPDYVNKPVWLVVSKSDSRSIDKWREQVAGFFGSSGVGAGATTLGAALGVGPDTLKMLAQAVQLVGTNPASDIDDWVAYALRKWEESGSARIQRLRFWWSGVKGDKYIAFLTVSNPVLKGKTGTYARFKCTETAEGKYVIVTEPCESEDVTSTKIGAPLMALMISAMAGW